MSLFAVGAQNCTAQQLSSICTELCEAICYYHLLNGGVHLWSIRSDNLPAQLNM